MLVFIFYTSQVCRPARVIISAIGDRTLFFWEKIRGKLFSNIDHEISILIGHHTSL